MIRKTLAVLTLVVALLATAPAPAHAAPGNCLRQYICVYPGMNYRYTTTLISGLAQWCRSLAWQVTNHVGSVVNNTTLSRATFFTGPNCTGQSYIMHAQTWTPYMPGAAAGLESVRVW